MVDKRNVSNAKRNLDRDRLNVVIEQGREVKDATVLMLSLIVISIAAFKSSMYLFWNWRNDRFFSNSYVCFSFTNSWSQT